MPLQQIREKMRSKPKQLFLIDALGAVLTASLLSGVLANFERTFGMPQKVLYGLSLIAVFFAIYSFSCYFRDLKNWQPYLKAIAIANLSYCCLTAGLMVYFYQKLTLLGVLYFIGEIIIIVCLSIFELD